MSFNNLNLAPEIKRVISEHGYEHPTPIQSRSIPEILNGHDICACAQTGTGKTASFLLPSLTKLLNPPIKKSKGPRVLVLTPTRELALQVAKEAQKYSKYFSKINVVVVYGGVPYPKQTTELRNFIEVLIATPGRLIDHIDRGRIDFSRLEVLVLDEADQMLDMGFIEDIEKIVSKLPKTRQTLLFSATLKKNVVQLVKDLLKNPKEITIVPDIKNIKQSAYKVDSLEHKHAILENLLTNMQITQSIIFTSTKSYADELCEKLNDKGFNSQALHSDISQIKREKTIGKFRNGKIQFLIATDVAARGIDIKNVSHIFNFDLPNNVDGYIHRIGRTGRIGAEGLAISFVSKRDFSIFNDIERHFNKKIEINSIPGLEPKIQNNNNNRNNNKRFFGKRRFDRNENHFSRNRSKRSKH